MLYSGYWDTGYWIVDSVGGYLLVPQLRIRQQFLSSVPLAPFSTIHIYIYTERWECGRMFIYIYVYIYVYDLHDIRCGDRFVVAATQSFTEMIYSVHSNLVHVLRTTWLWKIYNYIVEREIDNK